MWVRVRSGLRGTRAQTPIYVIVRHILYMGTTISWGQLQRVLETKCFRDDVPLSMIDLKYVEKETKLYCYFSIYAACQQARTTLV